MQKFDVVTTGVVNFLENVLSNSVELVNHTQQQQAAQEKCFSSHYYLKILIIYRYICNADHAINIHHIHEGDLR